MKITSNKNYTTIFNQYHHHFATATRGQAQLVFNIITNFIGTNSPLYQYLQDLGHTDFEKCSSVVQKQEECTAKEGQKDMDTSPIQKAKHYIYLQCLFYWNNEGFSQS
uniref:Uncharacterized protein n=1 Tax=Anolis carolinensis TaxID=28377 RepID=A0A803TNQ8_ANOCA